MCEDFEAINTKCRNVNNDSYYSNFKIMEKQVEILYRVGRYGKWKSMTMPLPKEVKNVRNYCSDNLIIMNINFSQLQVIKVIDK